MEVTLLAGLVCKNNYWTNVKYLGVSSVSVVYCMTAFFSSVNINK